MPTPPPAGDRRLVGTGVNALERAARRRLDVAFAPRAAPVTGTAPGRVELIGNHLDYNSGPVAAVAIDLGVSVAVRESRDGVWRVASGKRHAQSKDVMSEELAPGGVASLPLAVARVLQLTHGIGLPALEMGIAATLPESAGLSSSAALCCATTVAILRLVDRRVSARALADVAYAAEHDVVGVPCGHLDQDTVVFSPPEGVLLLDFHTGHRTSLPWPAGAVVVACDTGAPRSNASGGFAMRRREAGEALALTGRSSYREVTEEDLDQLGGIHHARADHVTGETARTLLAAKALSRGDVATLGRLMVRSHESSARLYEVSCPELDAAVAGALRVRGVHGARMSGGGFGGTAIALVDADAADECRTEMERAVVALGAKPRSWVTAPAAGVAHAAADVIAEGSPTPVGGR